MWIITSLDIYAAIFSLTGFWNLLDFLEPKMKRLVNALFICCSQHSVFIWRGTDYKPAPVRTWASAHSHVIHIFRFRNQTFTMGQVLLLANVLKLINTQKKNGKNLHFSLVSVRCHHIQGRTELSLRATYHTVSQRIRLYPQLFPPQCLPCFFG